MKSPLVFPRGRAGRGMSAAVVVVALAAVSPVAAVLPSAGAADQAATVSYFRQIRPILQANCQGCHQPAKAEGGYVMTEPAKMLAAGDSGTAGIVPGKPETSHLLEQIVPGGDGKAEMPKNGKPLTAAEIDLVRRWIAWKPLTASTRRPTRGSPS